MTTQVGAPAPSPAPDASVDLALCAYVLHKLAATAAAAIAGAVITDLRAGDMKGVGTPTVTSCRPHPKTTLMIARA